MVNLDIAQDVKRNVPLMNFITGEERKMVPYIVKNAQQSRLLKGLKN